MVNIQQHYSNEERYQGSHQMESRYRQPYSSRMQTPKMHLEFEENRGYDGQDYHEHHRDYSQRRHYNGSRYNYQSDQYNSSTMSPNDVEMTPPRKQSLFGSNDENESPFSSSSMSPPSSKRFLFSPSTSNGNRRYSYNHNAPLGPGPSMRGPSMPITMPHAPPMMHPPPRFPMHGYGMHDPHHHHHHHMSYYRPYSYAMTSNHHERRAFKPLSDSYFNQNKSNIDSKANKKAPPYRRKDKSLGLLCENFMSKYGNNNDVSVVTPQPHSEKNNKTKNIREHCISIDTAAEELGVERRRIYDIINILESIQIVSRKCKNTYNWHGTKHLPSLLSKLQRVASQLWKEDAKAYGITEAIEKSRNCDIQEDLDAAEEELERQRLKSLGKLSQEFLQLFLVGNETVNLNEATEKIVEGNNEARNKPQSETEKDKSSCWIKTKSRRLYDIANVLASIGVIARIGGSTIVADGSSQASAPQKHRGSFQWKYKIAPIDLPKHWTKEEKVQPEVSALENSQSEGKEDKENVEAKGVSKNQSQNQQSSLEKIEMKTDAKEIEKTMKNDLVESKPSIVSLKRKSYPPSKPRRNVVNLFSPVSKKKRKHNLQL